MSGVELVIRAAFCEHCGRALMVGRAMECSHCRVIYSLRVSVDPIAGEVPVIERKEPVRVTIQ